MKSLLKRSDFRNGYRRCRVNAFSTSAASHADLPLVSVPRASVTTAFSDFYIRAGIRLDDLQHSIDRARIVSGTACSDFQK